MRKIQQFFVAKFTSDILAQSNFNINRTFGDLRNKKELVSLADAQVLRHLRTLRHQIEPDNTTLAYTPELIRNLKLDKKALLRQEKRIVQNRKSDNRDSDNDSDNISDKSANIIGTNNNYINTNTPPTKQEQLRNIRSQIQEITSQINQTLYIPEYVLIKIINLQHYNKMVKQGLFINGVKYERLLTSASMARLNTVAFVRCDYKEQIDELLDNGVDLSIEITEHKYNAYFALSSTATHIMSTPSVLLIDDCEVKRKKLVDAVVENDNTEYEPFNREKIVREEQELDFNLFDGAGLISIEKAKEWSEELELDYIPSVFVIRNAFVKGCLFTCDFRLFAREKQKTFVKDLYGNSQQIATTDIILTKSQHKMWNGYSSMEQYQAECNKRENTWGVAKVSPKQDDDYFLTNYQFLQILDLDDEHVEKLCQPTLDWLKGISGDNYATALLFFMGKLCLDEKYKENPMQLFKQGDAISKALMVNPLMIEDEHIQRTLRFSINKKIKESYIGKLLARGCFATMIPDLYALMEWAFGLPVNGLLKDGEHYSRYWNDRNVSVGMGLRSPLTWKSESNYLTFIKNEETEKWFKYCNSGTIFNIWGADVYIMAGADFDGDLSATTDDDIIIMFRHTDNVPVVGVKTKVAKRKIRKDKLWKADLDSFNSTIGSVTNYSTELYDLRYRFLTLLEDENLSEEDREYYTKCLLEIEERLRLTKNEQESAIDKAKGIKTHPYPSHWIKLRNLKTSDDVDNEEEWIKSPLEYRQFLNDICANKKPYFFIQRYPALKQEYDNYLLKKRQMAVLELGVTLQEVLDKVARGEGNTEEQKFVEKYYSFCPVTDYNSTMNKICHYMENQISLLDLPKQNSTPLHLIDLLRTSSVVEEGDISFLDGMCKKYYNVKGDFKKKSSVKNISRDDGETFIATFEQYKRILKEDIEQHFDTVEDLVNVLIEYSYIRNKRSSKSFAWDLFGNEIVSNLITNTAEMYPEQSGVFVFDRDGEIEYLHKRFTKVSISFGDNNDNQCVSVHNGSGDDVLGKVGDVL